ncbi:hypothetical protein NADFUDRAFT_47264 [Nadsonia fulvescens var. elongata DSM 6958]|uniref:Restriction of telomere capping protein 5 n=1 Tax=Nadsonia fulvescens var. elongata DSM 6958 TaxID=857566 RepID=A0A1E3PHF6_9ASCO|nr:hypothetical protein NADFUDRAFT_47264 [Nadsonia fulvescens var. elongata DSM 6958]
MVAVRENFKAAIPSLDSKETEKVSDKATGDRHWTTGTLLSVLFTDGFLPSLYDELAPIVAQSIMFLSSFPIVPIDLANYEESCINSELTFEQLLIAIALVTGRYESVIYGTRNLATNEGITNTRESDSRAVGELGQKMIFLSFSLPNSDEPRGKELESVHEKDYYEVSLSSESPFLDLINDRLPSLLSTRSVPLNRLQTVFTLLLLCSSLRPGQELKSLGQVNISDYRKAAQDLTASFSPSNKIDENNYGITWETFKLQLDKLAPRILDAYGVLFETLLYNPKPIHSNINVGIKQSKLLTKSRISQLANLLPTVTNSSQFQLSGVISMNEVLESRLKPLFMGSEHGFSMGSFENKLLGWQAPTILLVSGIILSESGASGANGRAFDETIPHLKIKPSPGLNNDARSSKFAKPGQAVIFGIYISTPWKNSVKACFGTSDSLLFQLSPNEDVFPASTLSKSYATFSKSFGIGFGNPVHTGPQHSGSTGGGGGFDSKRKIEPGNVSLTINESLEFASFRNNGPGGSFRASTNPGCIGSSWEYRFKVKDVEVWGVGRDEDLEAQRKRWEWEDREAKLRQAVNIKNLGDERAFLEMAGIIGNGNSSGGSM